jgi:tetratricopeptide (TPR) repeat protein
MTLPPIDEPLAQFADRVTRVLSESPHVVAYNRMRAAQGTDRVLNEDSARLWEEYLRAHPDDPMALHHLAVIAHGRAIEAERQGLSDPAQLAALWTRALGYWSALWRQDTFWEGVKQRWKEALERGDEPLAVTFDPQEWDRFRRRLPDFLLPIHCDRARQGLQSDPAEAKRWLTVIKKSGFDKTDINQVRGDLYAPFQPHDMGVKQQAGYAEAVKRIKEYLAADPDYAEALCDLARISGQWIAYLVNTQTGHEEERKSLDDIVEGGRKAARHKAALALAREDSMSSQSLADFHLAVREYAWQKAVAAYEREDIDELDRWLERAWQAAREAIPLERTGQCARDIFFRLLDHAIRLKLDRVRGPNSSEFEKARELVQAGCEEDPKDPYLLRQMARMAAAEHKPDEFARLLEEAESEAQQRGNTELAGEINSLRRNGPDREVAMRHRREGIDHLKGNRPHEAVRCLEKALALCPNEADLEFHLGYACFLDSQVSRARQLLEKARTHALQHGPPDLLEAIDKVLVMLRSA